MFEDLPEDVILGLADAAKIRNLIKLSEIASQLLKDEQSSVPGYHLEGLVLIFDFAGSRRSWLDSAFAVCGRSRISPLLAVIQRPHPILPPGSHLFCICNHHRGKSRSGDQ